MKSRRGLSSVVGMIFAIIAIVTSVSYVTFSLNTLDQYNQSTLDKNQEIINAGQESFQLFSTKFAGGKFNITVANTGNLPINITRMWVQNTSATDWTYAYTINKMVGPGNLLTNIGQSSPVGANPLYAYNIKLATSRGNSMQFSIGSTNANPLFMQLEMVPTSVRSPTNSLPLNVTLLYIVTNNMTSNNALVNLTPQAPNCVKSDGGVIFGTLSGPFPSQYPSLGPGSTAIFKWIYQISNNTKTPNHNVKCTVQLQNGLASNTASDTVWMTN